MTKVLVPSFAVGALLCAHAAPAQQSVTSDDYVSIVLRAHPSVRRAAGFDAAAAAESRAARLLPDPTLELGVGRGRSNEAFGGSGVEREFAVRQVLPWPPRFRAGVRAADRAADALRANGALARWELEVAARWAFSRLGQAREGVRVAGSAEASARSVRDLVGRRAELGEAREADRIRTAVEWMRQERLIRTDELEAAAAEAVVRNLAVEPLPNPLTVAVEDPRAPVPLDRASLQALLAQGNPRLRAAEAELARTRAELSVARGGRVPEAELTVARSSEIDKSATGVHLGFRLPLWNANRGEVARAEAAVALAEADVQQLQVSLAADFEVRLKELDAALGRLAVLETQIIPASSRTLELARLSYEAGETSLLDLLDAQRTHAEAQRETVEARLAVSEALAGVRLSVGPSFNPWRQP